MGRSNYRRKKDGEVVVAADICDVLRRKEWSIKKRSAKTGTVYVVGTQGFKRVVIRIADHKQPVNVKSRIHPKNRPDFDFYPGSADTLNSLIAFLDDPSSVHVLLENKEVNGIEVVNGFDFQISE